MSDDPNVDPNERSSGEDAGAAGQPTRDVLSADQLAEAKQVYAFAQLANPLAVEPLIGQITVEWEERGPERAGWVLGCGQGQGA